MATPNRSALIARTLKVLRKHYKPVPPPKDRSLFEHLLFACLLEDSPHEAAEQVFNALKQDYFGWNEVRVSTIRELTDALKPLVNPAESAARLKQTLHSVFESVYEFDIETLKKQNIGQAAKHLQKYNGTTPFVVAYVTQNALGGHSIPLNRGALITLHTVGVISDDEFKQGHRARAGTGRAARTKAPRSARCCTSWASKSAAIRTGQTARKLMLEIDPNCKDRLPKRPTQAAEPPSRRQSPPSRRPSKGRSRGRSAKKEGGRRESSRPATAKPTKSRRRSRRPSRPPKPAGHAKKADEARLQKHRRRKATKKPDDADADEEETTVSDASREPRVADHLISLAAESLLPCIPHPASYRPWPDIHTGRTSPTKKR